MSVSQKPATYRDAIDALVSVCKSGQGQVGPNRARSGIWNRNASETFLPDEHHMNQVLSKLSSEEREALAQALSQEFTAGIFEALKILEEQRITPFQDGYEGGACQDFIGRLGGWEWPRE